MELLILRHGKSSWSHPDLMDYDRPLKKRGIRNAQEIGKYLLRQGWLPDCTLASSAVRAAETARLALGAMDLSGQEVIWSERFYHGSPSIWLTALAKRPDREKRVLIVGHNPGLEDLLELLCGPLDREPDGKLLPTAAVARLQLKGRWCEIGANFASLLSLERPRNL